MILEHDEVRGEVRYFQAEMTARLEHACRPSFLVRLEW
jgi:hypothetical protein